MKGRILATLAVGALTVGCGGNNAPGTGSTNNGSQTNTGTSGTTGTNNGVTTGANNTSGSTTGANNTTSSTTGTNNTAGTNGTTGQTNNTTGTSEVLVDCESLTYGITCDRPDVDANGYLACSDYFGDLTGVEVQCSANPNVDVRTTPPCQAYEHYVGSCKYYSQALPDRCYVTHVGAESADKIAAGRTFWETACAGEWISGP